MRERLKEDLEKAVTLNCPVCGEPGDVNEWSYRRGVLQMGCMNGACPFRKWDPRLTEEEIFEREEMPMEALQYEAGPQRVAAVRGEEPSTIMEEAVEEEAAEEPKKEAPNPQYVRRIEPISELREKIQTWLLRKVKQLDDITRIDVIGKKGDEEVIIEYPRSYGGGLRFRVGTRGFSFNMEAKEYKTLKEKTKVDIWDANPSKRAEVHRFFDDVVNTDMDPFLPEDEVQEVLVRYGEAVQPKEETNPPEVETGRGSTVSWLLHTSVGDVNWNAALQRATVDELRYCIERETRKTALDRLNARLRKLERGG